MQKMLVNNQKEISNPLIFQFSNKENNIWKTLSSQFHILVYVPCKHVGFINILTNYIESHDIAMQIEKEDRRKTPKRTDL